MPIAARTARVSDYYPIPSVWEGHDAELLERILDFYPRHEPRLILDATVMNLCRYFLPLLVLSYMNVGVFHPRNHPQVGVFHPGKLPGSQGFCVKRPQKP